MKQQDHLALLMLAANQKTKEKDYWLDKLAGELVKSRFPYDYNQGAIRSAGEAESIFQIIDTRLGRRLSARLLEVAGGSDYTLHIILAAALAALLNKYTGSQDIIVGTPIYKNDVEREFINAVLPLRYRLEENTSFKDLLFQARRVVSEAVEHQNYPIQLLANRLDMLDSPGSEDAFSLFDTAILLENIHDKNYLRPLNPQMTFSFSFAGNGRDTDALDVAVEYSSLRYRETTVKRIISHLQHLLETMSANADTKISAIEILTEEEKRQLLDTFCHVGTGYPEDKTIHGLFGEQVACTPGNIALLDADGGQPVSYRELNEKSDRLARCLREHGVADSTIVALLLPRTPDMMVAIMAVLKAGGAYLPIDPGYPEERIDYMLIDSGAKVEVTAGTLVEDGYHVGRWEGEKICLEENLNIGHTRHASCPLPSGNSSNPAYVIYTSGTTGKPKGVLIEHKNVVRLLFNDRFQFDFNDRDVWTLFHSYSFDFSVWEMYGALLYGGQLIVIPHEMALDPTRFLDTVKKHRVTVLNQTPSAFYNFIHEALKEESSDLELRYVIFGGEALKPGKLREWNERYPHTRLVNMFGITETTVHVTYKDIGEEEIAAESSNIGGPIPTLCIYVLDRFQRLMPLGTPGELCVGGAGVARGYLNRPELTTERFVDNPYNPGEWLYKSGDLARVIENGDMEYLGRIDHQVQFHGFRIELGEIESQLLRYDDVKDVVVLTTGEENEISLCAYVVPTSPETFDVSNLKEHLVHRLPGYMVPSYFVKLDKIPLTANGKVDRKALPEPGGNFDRYIAPRNSLERRLTKLWAQALKLDKVGVTDNYFDIGGDSIKAIRLVSLINSELNISIRIVDIYTHGTIETLAEKIADHSEVIDPENEEQIISQIKLLKDRIIKEIESPGNIEDIYPMTDIEKGISFYYLKHMGTGLYHDQFIYPVTYRDFDIQRMKRVLGLMMEKHSILRTSFNIGDYEEHVQIVHNEVPLPVEYHNLSDKEPSRQEEFMKEFCLEDRKNPFNSAQPPLWKITFFSIDKDNILVLFVCHHAILDGWSVASLVTEVNDIYLKLEFEPEFRPEPLSADYKDAVISEIQEKQNTESIEYWKKELMDYNRLDIFETVKSDVATENMKMFRYDLGRESLEELRETAKKNNTSIKNLCFAAYVYVMDMLSNEEDVVVGNVSNNRPVIHDGDKILGCFLNTVPVRVKIPYGQSWAYYIRMIEEKILDLRKYERMPLFEIARVIGEKSKDKNPFFDTLFNFKDFHVLQQIKDTGEKIKTAGKPSFSIPRSEDTNTLFDFEVDITMDYLVVEPKYRPLALDHKTVEKCCVYFKRVLDTFINDPDLVMSKKDIISDEEKQTLLFDFNDTSAPYSREKTMHQLFEEQVAKSPEGVALIDRDGVLQWTYEELNNRSNQLAGFLRKGGVKPGGLIAVILDRSVYMVMAVLGILKAGGAYVPLEPYLPDQRIRKILDSLNIETLITNEAQLLKIERISRELPLLTHIISLDKRPGVDDGLFEGKELSGPEAVEREGVDNLPPTARSGDIAYVIFTSGSTGTPKGVVETHRPVINVIEWVNKTFDVGSLDKLLFVASLSFDLSVYDIFGILASGGALRVVEAEDIKNPGRLLDIIMNEGITFWDSAPAALQQLVPFFHEVAGYPVRSRLRLVFLSGDWIPVTMPDALRDTFAGVQVISLGGATEATIWSNYYPIGEVDPSWPSIPYGKPIQNAKYYILDRNLDVCPFRVPGDLYIGGECLAEEYINDDQLSAHKFIANPFVPGEKIYRTGDIARWIEGGNMQFLGRKDNQVKIRGYRIELGEIESQLLNHPEVRDGIVLDRLDGSGHKCLCAYYVCKTAGEEIDRDELKQFLSQELPEYMLPGYFIPIDRVPLTANGKLDRNTLPEPEAGVNADREFTGPENATQVQLVAIWSQVLGVEQESISIESDFFELGGHSLNATMVISRIHKELNVKVPLAEIFNRPTISELSSIVNTLESGFYASVEPVEKKEYYLLSSAQRRLYFLQQMEPGNTGYNIQEGVVLEGILDLSVLESPFKQLIKRHESLRTFFDLVNEETVQRISDDVEFEIEYYEDGSIDAQRNFIRAFDLSKAPLLRVGLFRLAEDKHILLTDMHHIISDGVSHAILKGDFEILYSGGHLPAGRLQYKDYSEWQNSEKQRQVVGRQVSYWLKELSGEIPVLDIPTDYPRPAIQSYEGNTLEFDLGRDETEFLNKLGRDEKATLYMVLVAIYNVLLFKLGIQEEIIIGTPTAGRPHSDLERIIGMFVNTLVLKNYPSGEKTFTGFLQEVKDKTIKAFENQDCQFEELVEQLSVKRDPSRNPVFDVVFVIQNMEVQAKGTLGTGESGVDADDSGSTLKPYRYASNISKFDLTLTAVEYGDRIHLALEYCTRLFKEATVKRMADYFKRIVFAVKATPDLELSEIKILSEEEKNRLLYDFNDTAADYPQNKTIHGLFEEQVERTPDHIAVIAQSKVHAVTYRELNEKADHQARRLIEKGIQPGDIVGIMIERSMEMIVGIFGILKSGGAYLPIDVNYPRDRIDYMLRDSSTNVMITAAALAEKGENVGRWEGESIFLEEDSCPVSTCRAACSLYRAKPSTLSYVIYTSGSTGNPKGVMIEHRSVVNRLHWMQRAYPILKRDVIMQKTPFVFDVSVWELFWWSQQGASLCLLGVNEEKNPEAVMTAVGKNGVTTMHFVPSMLQVFLEYCRQAADLTALAGLRQVFASGEALSVYQVESFHQLLNSKFGSQLFNLYGPTEATVDVSYYNCAPGQKNETVPIGKPIDNVKLYIVDKSLHLQPVGVAGELCISGVGLARGYLNRPELTTEKFIKPRTLLQAESFMPCLAYRTGDLARWRPDANIEFLGRIDHQVKLRGFRIELGEIEAQLLKHKDIKGAAVILKKRDGTNSGSVPVLFAYIVTAKEKEFNASQLREYLSGTLPDYMVPSNFKQLEKIPLTPNGKVDFKGLELLGKQLDTGTPHVSPRNDTEKKVADIWSEVLGLDRIGIHDNYFELGGTSFDIIRINRRLEEIFQLDIPVVTMFRYTTIFSFVSYLNSDGNKEIEIAEIPDRSAALERGKMDRMQRHRIRRGVGNG